MEAEVKTGFLFARRIRLLREIGQIEFQLADLSPPDEADELRESAKEYFDRAQYLQEHQALA